MIVSHRRQYGDVRTDVSDYSTTLSVLSRNAGAWNNSGIRKELPDPLRDYLDGLEKPELKDKLRLMSSAFNDEYGYRAAVDAMAMSLKNGDVNSSDATIIAQRITGYGIDTPPESGTHPLQCMIWRFLSRERRVKHHDDSQRTEWDARRDQQTYCKKLFFTTAIPEMCQTDGTPKQIEYLHDALKKEIENREINHIQRLIKRARFPVYKTFEGYDFGQTKLPPALSKEDPLNVSFIEKSRTLSLYTQWGLGRPTWRSGMAYWPAKRLQGAFLYGDGIDPEAGGSEKKRHAGAPQDSSLINMVPPLILDEWGYVPVDRDGSELLFQVISDSYESRSLILTTNIEFSKWGGIFTDEQMVAAMIDRLVHHGHLIMFDGRVIGCKDALMRQTVPQNDEIVS